jgi:acetyl-CoA synthase
MGQRTITWVRISKDAHARGFQIKHFGSILTTKIHNDFSSIIDRVQVTIITDPEKIKAPLEEARAIYRKRDDRIGGLTDEAVEDFYSCVLCQSYAPNHVCIVTPERLGLCGAYSWIDCKASYQINKHGPNEPVKKGACLDPVRGQWENINAYIAIKSNGNLQRFNAYSILEDPMTSCGCFECIVAIVPEANGVMIVDREHQGLTPIGMKFSTLAGQIGGGVQMPGFTGIGKLYVTSNKFISAEGGLDRVVWMSKILKDEIHDRLVERLKKIGKEDLLDKIATEENAETAEQLVSFLEKVEHPALTMPALL